MTWLEFKTKALAWTGVDGRRIGVASTLVAAALIEGVRQLQQEIPALRVGHEDTVAYNSTGVVALGEATQGAMPVGGVVLEAWVHKDVTLPCGTVETVKVRCVQRDWLDRMALIEGAVDCAYIAIDPAATKYVVTPRLQADPLTRLVLIWSGVKDSFADADVVRFEGDEAQAVGHYIKSLAVLDIERDIALRREHAMLWVEGLRDCFLKWKRRGRADNAERIEER